MIAFITFVGENITKCVKIRYKRKDFKHIQKIAEFIQHELFNTAQYFTEVYVVLQNAHKELSRWKYIPTYR